MSVSDRHRRRPPHPRPGPGPVGLQRRARARPRGAGLMAAPPPGQGTVSAAEGVVTGAPRRWLLLEGLVLLAGTLIAFGALGQPWWLAGRYPRPRHRHDRLPGRNPSRRAP